jgi:hypothetical protein
MKTKTYTQDEVLKNINTHQKKLDQLVLSRKELNKDISSVKKQIIYWTELDKSQIKMF